MKRFKQCAFACAGLLLLTSLAEAKIPPHISIRCEGGDTGIDVDLYYTGHPMSGIYGYDGILAVSAPELPGPRRHFVPVELELVTSQIHVVGGASFDPFTRYRLALPDDFFRTSGKPAAATFTFRIADPVTPSGEVIERVECKRISD